MTYKEEYLVKNIRLNNINKTINNLILEHKKKFLKFKFDCRIDSVIEKFDKNIKVNLHIIFYSEKKDVTHNYYLKCPKPMVETHMLKILDINPSLIKSVGGYLELIPPLERIIYKYWGRIDFINNKNKLVLDRNWYEFNPKQPSRELLELMRSY